MSKREKGIPGNSFTLQDAKKEITARRATEAANQISGALEITRYDVVLLACERTELLPPNLPFFQILDIRMAKKLLGDGPQILLDLLYECLGIDHSTLLT